MSLRLFFFLNAVLLHCISMTYAQVETTPTNPQATERIDTPQQGTFTESKLVLHLKDKDGILRPVPNYTFEDFERMSALDAQLNSPIEKPKFRMDNYVLTASDRGKHADLKTTIQITTDHLGWVRVPLRMKELVFLSAKYSGPVKHFLTFEEDGYVCWIQSRQEQKHTIEITGILSLVGIGEEKQIELTVPRCLESKATVRTQIAKPVVSFSEQLSEPDIKVINKQSSELIFQGLDGKIQILWHQENEKVAEKTVELEAAIDILAKVEGSRVESNVFISVNSFNQNPFDQLKIRLPEKAQLVFGSVKVVAPEADTVVEQIDSTPGKEELLDIRLNKPTAGPLEIRLTAERLPSTSNQLVKLSGYEVIDAARQYGHLAVQVIGDWQLIWNKKGHVWQKSINELPATLRSSAPQIGFEYSLPASLSANVKERQSRVSVDPEYRFNVFANYLELNSSLKYTIHRAAVDSLELSIPKGWTVDASKLTSVPAGIIDFDELLIEEGRLLIPFRERQIGRLELAISARKELPAKETRISLELPRPRVNNLGPSLVEIQPADNVLLTPDKKAMIGMSRYVPLLTKSDPNAQRWQQKKQTYRTDVATAKFVSKRIVRPGKQLVSVLNRVKVDDDGAQVEQTLDYEVLFEPLDEISLSVPNHLLDAGKLTLRLDGVALTPFVEPSQEQDSDSHTKMRVTLPARQTESILNQEQIGRIKLTASYRQPFERLEKLAGAKRAIQLIIPMDGELIRNQIVLQSEVGIQAQVFGESWKTVQATPASTFSQPGDSWFASSAWHPSVNLVITQSMHTATEVKKTWIQSFVLSKYRFDRVYYRFASGESTFQFTLPEGVSRSSLLVHLDGKEVATQSTPGTNQFIVSIANPDPNHEWLLDLEYAYTKVPSEKDQLHFSPPVLEDHVRVHQSYWELIFPDNRHLIFPPDNLSQEYAWEFDRFSWGRICSLTQSGLADWIGIQTENSDLTQTNRYLFSNIGPIPELNSWVVPQSLLVLSSSGVILLLGLSFIYIPFFRRTGVFFVMALLVGTLSALAPGPAILIGQAASLGITLAILALYLRFRHNQRISRGAVVRAANHSKTNVPASNPPKSSILIERASTATQNIDVASSGSES